MNKMNKNKKLKREQGITLIVLVITIIVLLILAEITITAITGDNGIIKNAGSAKERTEIENEKEIVEKSTVQAMGSNKYGNIVESELQKKLNNETGEGKTEVKDLGDVIKVLFVDSNRSYAVDKNGNVRVMTWWEKDDENGNNFVTNGDAILQIGDYITYKANDNGEHSYVVEADKSGVTTGETQVFSDSYETKWRLLGIEHNSDGDYLMLVPSAPVKSSASKGLTLRGATGYQYGIEIVENISEIYGYGTGAAYSRAMEIEDVNRITGYDPTNTGDGKVFREGTIYEYGIDLDVTRTADRSNKIVASNGIEDNYYYVGWRYFNTNREWTNVNIGETVTITNTYYTYYPTTLTDSSTGDIKGIKTDSREYKMLFSSYNNNFWLASSYEMGGGENECISYAWGLFNVGALSVQSCRDNYLIYVGGNQLALTKGIMPIVCLDSGVKLKETGNQVNSCAEWEINV